MSSIEHGGEPQKVCINSALIFFVIHRLSEKNYQYQERMKQLLPVLKKRHRTRPVYNLGLSHCLASLRGSKMENCLTGRKMDRLHKFAPCKDSAHLQKLRSKSGQRRKMPHLPSYLHPCFLVCKCVIYHQFAPYLLLWLLQIYGIFARSKFVQIHFFVQFSSCGAAS